MSGFELLGDGAVGSGGDGVRTGPGDRAGASERTNAAAPRTATAPVPATSAVRRVTTDAVLEASVLHREHPVPCDGSNRRPWTGQTSEGTEPTLRRSMARAEAVSHDWGSWSNRADAE